MRRILLILAFLLAPALVHAAPADRVLLISLDGLDPRLVRHMPRLSALMRRGSSTLSAETPLPAVTVVSHAALFTGASPEKNGVDSIETKPDGELRDWRPLKVRTVVSALAAQRRYVSAFIQKVKLWGLLPKGAVNGGHGEGDDSDELAGLACGELKYPPAIAIDALIFVHLKALDSAGHAHGWMSPEQLRAAALVDEDVAYLAECARKGDRALRKSTVIIITSDHGGHGRTHGTEDDRHVPWIAYGPGIKVGHRIRGPVRLIDTAPTILKLLGYEPANILPDADGSAITEILSP